MALTRNKLYLFLLTTCLAGYVWIGLNQGSNLIKSDQVSLCLIHQITSVPCPSCGSTRSAVAFIHGNFHDAIYLNPLGIIVILILVITPLWIIFDLIRKKESLLRFYFRSEEIIRRKTVAIPLVTLLLVNWIWNIMKGL